MIDSAGSRFALSLKGLQESSSLVIEGIPVGRYSFNLHSSGGLFDWSTDARQIQEGTIDANTTTDIRFDLRRYSLVELHVIDGAGELYGGSLVAEVFTLDADGGWVSVFSAWNSGPHVLGLLHPGKYGLTLHQPFGYGGEEPTDVFDVPAGEHVVLPLLTR
ncbi:MAG: hypothetical protein AB1726_02415 [Planctomycetota bacterium]